MLVASYLGGEWDQDLGQYRERADEERGHHQDTEGRGQGRTGEGHDQPARTNVRSPLRRSTSPSGTIRSIPRA
jgi:hypothetical protein